VAAMVTAFVFTNLVAAGPANASAATISLSGYCRDYEGDFIQGQSCDVIVKSSSKFKGRKIRIESRNYSYGQWYGHQTFTLNSSGTKRLSFSDDCTYVDNDCAGITYYRVVILKSGTKAQVVSNTIFINYIQKQETYEPPVNLPKEIPNQPKPKLQLSSDGSSIVLTGNSWAVNANTLITWYQNGLVIAGAHSDSIRLTKSMSDQPIKVKIDASSPGYNSAVVWSNEFSTSVYPLSSASSVKQVLVDGLAWYCTAASRVATNTSTWTLISYSSPYTLYAVSSGGIIYLDVKNIDFRTAQITRSVGNDSGLANSALDAWGCPHTMNVIIQ